MSGRYTCRCCGQDYETESAASACCAPDENTLHLRRDMHTTLTLCGLPAVEVNWQFEQEFIAHEQSEGFDPNHYCHTCIGENQG